MRKINNNEFIFDCKFYDGNKVIFVCVESDGTPIKNVRGVEKMSGFLRFVDSNGNNLGTIDFYENYEDTSPITEDIALKYYKRLVRKFEKR